MRIKVSNTELEELLVGESKEFPKYTPSFINLANRYSQGTRPKIVGQLSEMIKDCPYNTYEERKKLMKNLSNFAIEKGIRRKKPVEPFDKSKLKLVTIDFIS